VEVYLSLAKRELNIFVVANRAKLEPIMQNSPDDKTRPFDEGASTWDLGLQDTTSISDNNTPIIQKRREIATHTRGKPKPYVTNFPMAPSHKSSRPISCAI
jgi:hypothetical protein